MELLVVIAIIATLAMLLSFGSARISASNRQTKCVSNLRQIGVATLAYVADNNGAIPYETRDRVGGGGVDIWTHAIDSYLPIPEQVAGTNGLADPVKDSVYFCPEADSRKDWGGRAPDYGANARINNRAGIDPGVFARQGWTNGAEAMPKVRLAAIQYPAKTLLYTDSFVPDAANAQSLKKGYWGLLPGLITAATVTQNLPVNRIAPRHSYNGKDARTGRFNAVFCDGHVESILYGELASRSAEDLRSLRVPF